MSWLWFIVIGLVAGLIARAVVPGRQNMGLLLTTLLGIVGSFVGGMIGSAFSRSRNFWDLQPSGLILSILGAIAVLFLYGVVTKKTGHGGRRVTA